MLKALAGVLGGKGLAIAVGGLLLAGATLAAYDKWIDDPHVAALAKAEAISEVNASTARRLAEASRMNAAHERAQQARVDELVAENEKLEGEVDDLVRKFESVDGADDDSGIDGEFVR